MPEVIHLVKDDGVLCGQPNYLLADPYPWIVSCKKCLHKLDKVLEKSKYANR